MADEQQPVKRSPGGGNSLFLKSKDQIIVNSAGDHIKIHRKAQTKAQTASDDPGEVIGITLQFANHKYDLDTTTEAGKEDIQTVEDFFGVVIE